jgi:hypothetical protein
VGRAICNIAPVLIVVTLGMDKNGMNTVASRGKTKAAPLGAKGVPAAVAVVVVLKMKAGIIVNVMTRDVLKIETKAVIKAKIVHIQTAVVRAIRAGTKIAAVQPVHGAVLLMLIASMMIEEGLRVKMKTVATAIKTVIHRKIIANVMIKSGLKVRTRTVVMTIKAALLAVIVNAMIKEDSRIRMKILAVNPASVVTMMTINVVQVVHSAAVAITMIMISIKAATKVNGLTMAIMTRIRAVLTMITANVGATVNLNTPKLVGD